MGEPLGEDVVECREELALLDSCMPKLRGDDLIEDVDGHSLVV